MSDETTSQDETASPDNVAIENRLPLTAIDIESQKDMSSGRYHPLRSLHKWFAARPTPAARLAIIASAYPGEIDPDLLLKLMQIGPQAVESNIPSYVEEKFRSKSQRTGSLDEHYGYDNPTQQTPTVSELEQFHDKVRKAWGGDLPSILDPTAGRGIIPFEAQRYGFDVVANELNPVPSLIMKVGLDYATSVGSLEPDIYDWRDKIHTKAKEKIEPYYPTVDDGNTVLNSALTYLIECDSCGGKVPLTSKWWLNKTSSGGDAVRPIYENGEVSYEYVDVEKASDEYDPSDAPVTRGDAECPHCMVVTEEEDVRSKIRAGEFEYSIYGVNYETPSGDRLFRGGKAVDKQGMERAVNEVENNFELIDFLSEPINEGLNTSQIKRYGMDSWQEVYTPRQLVVQFEFLQAYQEVKEDIIDSYPNDKAKAILAVLSLCASRTVMFNNRLCRWYDQRGIPHGMFAGNNLSLKRMCADNNLSAPRRGYISHSNHVIESYEELVEYIRGKEPAEMYVGDAAVLPDKHVQNVDIAVVDPPYYSSIMYAELSDVFYVLQKRYLSDEFPEFFETKLTNKEDEAVANPARFEDIAEDGESQDELANQKYENKMTDIFDSINDMLDTEGVMAIMFTHRDMDAWDTLTTALIEAGFNISATHPIKTEMSDRVGLQDKASADSSILLAARKRKGSTSSDGTFWEDIQDDIARIAREEAEQMLSSENSISKVDTAIAAYGPTLHRYAEEYPVIDKKGDVVRPRVALTEARKEVTSVIAEEFIDTDGIYQLDSLSRWYILVWLIYDNNNIPYDEGRQLGVAAGIDIDEIKRPTKIWRGGKEMTLQQHNDRVQDVVLLRDSSVDNPSSRKYPVNPLDVQFTYTIDAVHAAIHVYERDGAKAAWNWLTERNMNSNKEFGTVFAALIEILPKKSTMRDIMIDIVSGETGDYLNIELGYLEQDMGNRQSSLGDHTE